MAEEKNSTVHSKHEIQYITDDRTGHLKLDPFNRDVKREERSREKELRKSREHS